MNLRKLNENNDCVCWYDAHTAYWYAREGKGGRGREMKGKERGRGKRGQVRIGSHILSPHLIQELFIYFFFHLDIIISTLRISCSLFESFNVTRIM